MRKATDFIPILQRDPRVVRAVNVIDRFGNTDGAHHKQWVLLRAMRYLLGTNAYRAWLNELDKNGYQWEEGIAP